MSFLLKILIFLLLLAISLYVWICQKKRYWPKRGVHSDESSLFFFGRSEHVATYLQRIYRSYKNSGQRFLGIHLLFQPAVLLMDLDLIRNIFITDFESFPDRGVYHNTRDDPLTANIVRLSGEPWKRLRSKFTPTFTSAKMRYMCGPLVQVAKRFNVVISEQVQSQGEVLEIRDLCARFTTDVIGLVAFGIECDSLREPNTQFRLMGDKIFTSFNPFLETFCKKFPRLARGLHIKAFPREVIDFYTKIVTENVEYRELHKIRRNDFLDILLELKNTQKNGEFILTMKDIIAQSFVFFAAGFDTTATTMSFCLYELSQNQDIQQRAREEVLQCLQLHDNQLTYECMKDMKYLEQVVSETLRKHSVTPLLQRVARKDYIEPKSGKVIENGVPVIVPVYAIHRDPEYYPKPAIFDPDRFTPAAIQERHPMAYLPFGAGPRVCIAERFSRMQAMIGIAMLLRDFRFSNSAKTPKFLDFDIKMRGLSIAGGISLRVTTN